MSTLILTEGQVEETKRTIWTPKLLVRLTSLLAFLGILTYFSLAAPLFLSYANVLNVVQQSAVLGVLAFGMTTVFIAGGAHVISGGIDLSAASNMGLSAAIYASVTQAGGTDWIALPLTLLTGLIIGAVNAWAIVGLRIFPLLNGSSPGAGEMLLSVVLVALLGVIVSRRSVPTISGTLISSLFIGFLVNGFQLTNVSSYWLNGVQGGLILLVVAGSSFARRAAY
jgi:ribose transport system permease protein